MVRSKKMNISFSYKGSINCTFYTEQIVNFIFKLNCKMLFAHKTPWAIGRKTITGKKYGARSFAYVDRLPYPRTLIFYSRDAESGTWPYFAMLLHIKYSALYYVARYILYVELLLFMLIHHPAHNSVLVIIGGHPAGVVPTGFLLQGLLLYYA